jgi:ParB-like nuclease domain
MDILNNRLIKTELVEWKKLVPFQPDNLKKTEPHKLQKLANSLCQNGFSMNFYVWEKDGQILIIDGHSRHEVLQLLESGAIYPKNPDGKEYAVTIPEKLPCSFLHLKNKTEAKKAVLIYNSKYKNIDSDILAEWVSDLNLDELKSQIEIPELKLEFENLDYSDKNKEIDTNEFSDEMTLKFTFSEEDYIAVKGALSKINESPEIALMQVLKI